MYIADLEENKEWVYQDVLCVYESNRGDHTFGVSEWISNKDGSHLFVVSDDLQEILGMFTSYETARQDAEDRAYSFEVHTGE